MQTAQKDGATWAEMYIRHDVVAQRTPVARDNKALPKNGCWARRVRDFVSYRGWQEGGSRNTFGSATPDSRVVDRAFEGRKIKKTAGETRKEWGLSFGDNCLLDTDLDQGLYFLGCSGRGFGRWLYQMLDTAVGMKTLVMVGMVGVG